MSDAGTVLVTGGTGFVGSHVVDLLLEAGRPVRCLIRATSDLRWLEGKAVQTVEADLRRSPLSAAVDGVRAVIHCAGLTRGSPEALRAANVEGTRALLRACLEARSGSPRFVFCSSQAAAGPGKHDRPREPGDPPVPISDYGRSKLEAEAAVRDVDGALETVVLRPGAIYGPRDEDTFPFFQMADRRVMVVPGIRERRVQLVHVRDVARALLLAVDRPEVAGKTYFVAHPRAVTWKELAAAISRVLDRRSLVLPLPSFAFRLAGAVAESVGASERPGVLDRRRARDLFERAWTCDVDPTLEELGWEPNHDLEDGLRDTVRWYREEGWL